jgi:predicted type IV restriction endonuclease
MQMAYLAFEGTTTIAQGQRALSELLDEIRAHVPEWNEAETRFHFIDRFLKACLGWPDETVSLERSQDGQYTDYELGHPRAVIWEAKREGRYFSLPANPKRRLVRDLKSVMALDSEIESAIRQVQDYCIKRGVQFAVVCNGTQLICFLATRNDGLSPLDGRCITIDGYEQMLDFFPDLWQALSPAGIADRRLVYYLASSAHEAIPPKISNYLNRYPIQST